MLRVTVMGVLLYFASSVLLAAVATAEESVAQTTQTQAEDVTHRHSLAAHLGLTDDEAFFKPERDFRSRELNEMKLDDGDDVQPRQVARH